MAAYFGWIADTMSAVYPSSMKEVDRAQAVTAALKLIKEQLYTFGNNGDEAIQRLVSIEASLRRPDRTESEADLLRAFLQGMADQDRQTAAEDSSWSGDPVLRPAFELGRQAASLNGRAREANLANGWNVGPFDFPAIRAAMDTARERLERDSKDG